MTFRTRTFLGIFLATSVALGLTTWLVERSIRASMRPTSIASMLDQARLAAELLTRQPGLAEPDAEADAMGRSIRARVTLIAADGRVLGDSDVDLASISSLENHATREEIVAARERRRRQCVRQSATTNTDTMYTAVRVASGPVAFVRVALSLADGRRARRPDSPPGAGRPGRGPGVAALTDRGLRRSCINRRIVSVAETARRYHAGDFTRPARDHGARRDRHRRQRARRHRARARHCGSPTWRANARTWTPSSPAWSRVSLLIDAERPPRADAIPPARSMLRLPA